MESTNVKPADAYNEDVPPKKRRKLHTYEKAKLAYDRIKKEKEEKTQLAANRKREREEAVKKSKASKKRKMKMLYKKTKRGQPKLGQQVEILLEKIKKRSS